MKGTENLVNLISGALNRIQYLTSLNLSLLIPARTADQKPGTGPAQRGCPSGCVGQRGFLQGAGQSEEQTRNSQSLLPV